MLRKAVVLGMLVMLRMISDFEVGGEVCDNFMGGGDDGAAAAAAAEDYDAG